MWSLFLVLACRDSDEHKEAEAKGSISSSVDITDTGGTSSDPDRDRDGWTSDVDCDDNSAAIHPGAVDECNDGIDSDCDGDPGVDCALGGSHEAEEADWSVI